MTPSPVLEALKRALDSDPTNGPLWLHYAELLEQADQPDAAIAAYRSALPYADAPGPVLVKLVGLLREVGQLAEALIRAEEHLKQAESPALRLELARVLFARGEMAGAAAQYAAAQRGDATLHDEILAKLQPESPPLAAAGADPILASEWLVRLEAEQPRLTFADVAGLDAVKEQVQLRIIAPFKNPEIFNAYKRRAGGGILLYGPPGCGKTFIARATAGECGARFVSVGVHDLVDRYWGESEKMIHALFQEARRLGPTVLFFDEFDALGASRGKTDSQFWRTLVAQLLQEMDGANGPNQDVLVLAATNLPWNVDPAFRRPGRFDRVLFIPPPDEPGRTEILARTLRTMPGGDTIPVGKLASRTPLFTGADLVALCERASERGLTRSLKSGRVEPLTADDMEQALRGAQTSAREWLAMAKNYARYGNEAGGYDDLTEYLKQQKLW
ncbi:MAG TPA: AAA family ATPase [Oscillatoriaceae cyanobacterium]